MAGKEANIFYDDLNGVSCKTGSIIEKDNTFIVICTSDNKIISIPIHRIVRIETKIGGWNE